LTPGLTLAGTLLHVDSGVAMHVGRVVQGWWVARGSGWGVPW